jgi:hypothetical protein
MAAADVTVFYLSVLSGPRPPFEPVHAHCADKSQRQYEAAISQICQTPGFLEILTLGKSRLEVAIDPCGFPQICCVRGALLPARPAGAPHFCALHPPLPTHTPSPLHPLLRRLS